MKYKNINNKLNLDYKSYDTHLKMLYPSIERLQKQISDLKNRKDELSVLLLQENEYIEKLKTELEKLLNDHTFFVIFS